MRSVVPIFAVTIASLVGCATSGPLSLSGEAKPYALDTGRNASDAVLLARQELVRYLDQIHPTQFSVSAGDEARERPRIVPCLAGDPVLQRVDPPIAAPDGDGFVLAVRGPTIYLVGGDDRAVLYATYAFLERLGCRWLAPALDFYKGHNDVVPQRSQILFELDTDVHDEPVLAFRKLYVEEGHSHTEANLRQIIAWMPKLRFNTLVIPTNYSGAGRVKWDNWRDALTPELQKRGIVIEVGGHGYQNFLNAKMDDGKWFKEHPEWFAMNEKGERTPSPRYVICSSNPEAVAFLQKGVLNYLRERPEIEIFDLWPPDGCKWCSCDACKAMGTPSQRHVMLVSDMAAALRTELPRVRLECIAYSSYVEPAEGVRLDPGVLVDFCPIAQCFEMQIYEPGNKMNELYKRSLYGWRETFLGPISIYSYYRKYAWCSLPNLIPHYMQNDLRFYRDMGMSGISSYAEPADWGTYEVNHYVLGHLAWNPDANVNAILDEFCAARYGPEAKTAREAVDTLEAVVRHACTIPFTDPKTPEQYDAYAAQIDSVQKAVAAAMRRQQANDAANMALQRLSLMLEYAARDSAIQRQRAANGPTDERQKLADDLLGFLKEHSDQGVFLVNFRFEPPRRYPQYGLKKP